MCDLSPLSHPVLVYDGHCALCNRSVRWLLRRDRAGVLRFAGQDSATGRALLSASGLDPAKLDAVVLFDTAGHCHVGARAVLGALRLLGPGWRLPARLLGVLPPQLLDWAYRAVAQRRYRWFGRHDVCPTPPPGMADRFLH